MSDKLIPCPYCGSEFDYHKNCKDDYFYTCYQCGARVVASNWNTRAYIAPVRELLKRNLMLIEITAPELVNEWFGADFPDVIARVRKWLGEEE